MKIFIKTLNDLKPYYETFIRYLPPQQQKILHYIALAKMPQNGTEIGKNCFIEQKTLSKQLSELSRRNLIDAITDPDDKRNKLYDISEPLLRISIEIGEHREGISALFIDFLALYYSFDELTTQKNRFKNLWECETDPQLKEDLWHDVKAREKAIDLKKQLETNRKWSKAYLEFKEKYENKDFEGVIRLSGKIPENEREEKYYGYLSDSFYVTLQFEEALFNLRKKIEINPNEYKSWNNLGLVLYKLELYHEGIAACQNAITIKKEGFEAWYCLGLNYVMLKNYDKGEEYFKKAIDYNPKYYTALYGLGKIYDDLKNYSKAIEFYIKSIEVKKDAHQSWNNLGSIYYRLEDYSEAVYAYTKMIETGMNFQKESLEVKNILSNKISGVILFILQHDQNLNTEQVKHLENIIEKEYEMPKELEIPYLYLKTFRRFVLEKDEKALLELPKEQREFFVREILEKRKIFAQN